MAQQRLTDRSELASSPADGDLVHIVDVSDTTDNANGTSKKITIANLLANVQQTTGNKFVGDITLVSGYTYSAWQQNSVINGTTYSTYVADSSISLGAADGSNDRFDIIVFNSNGTFTVVAGTAAADPIIPTIDTDTQVIVRIIRVTAASSTESGVTNELVYDEDTGVTTEWNATTTANVNEASTEQAANGTKSIKFTSATTSDYVSLVDTSTHDGNLATQIKFQVYLPTSANYRFYVQVGNIIVVVQDGLYGFSSSTTASWQQIIIPASEFAGLSALSAYDTFVITNGRNNTTYFIDEIYIVEGFNTGSSEHPNYTLNLDGSDLQLLKDGNINSIVTLTTGGGTDPATDTGTVLDLSNPIGTYYNMSSADTNTTYTYTGAVLGGIAFKLVNCSTEPAVTGATKIYSGGNFQQDTDIYLITKYNGNRVEYWFENITVDLTQYIGIPYGAIIAETTGTDNIYLGTPNIYKDSNGRYFITHDYYGSGTSYNQMSVYYSDNLQDGFKKTATITGIFWTSMFEYNGFHYLLGCSQGNTGGDITLSKSSDGGLTWNTPITVLSAPGGGYNWHTTSQDVIFKDGYLVKCFDYWNGTFASGYQTSLVLADLTDIEDSSNWSSLTPVTFNTTAYEAANIGPYGLAPIRPPGTNVYQGMLEGSLVELSNGDLRLFVRMVQTPYTNHAVYFDITWNSVTPTSSSISTTHNFIDMAGGNLKFEVKYDSTSDKLYAITNGNRINYYSDNRMEAFLISSEDDGVTWTTLKKIFGYEINSTWEDDVSAIGCQYSSYIFDGDNILAVSRVANGASADFHDANITSLTAILNFRDITTEFEADTCVYFDTSSDVIQDTNGVSLILDRSNFLNSPYMLSADNSAKPSWSSGLVFAGAEYMRLNPERCFFLAQTTGLSWIAVIENVPSTLGLRIFSKSTGADDSQTGSYFAAMNVGFSIEACRGNYTDFTGGNDYIIGGAYDASNHYIYNYLNGANRGTPDSVTGGSYVTDHIEPTASFGGDARFETRIGARRLPAGLYFTGTIKALVFFPSYRTPTQMTDYMDTLNATYSIY